MAKHESFEKNGVKSRPHEASAHEKIDVQALSYDGRDACR
jgi:hypothetical protein